jgi:hypothetical protein
MKSITHMATGALAVAATLLSCLMLTIPAYAATEPEASLTITGEVTKNRSFAAYRIASYTQVDQVNGKPVGLMLDTVDTGRTTATITLCDGNTISNNTFQYMLGREVACIEDQRNGQYAGPSVAADGSIDGLDPLVWARSRWQGSTTQDDIDPWLNPGVLAAGPLRALADWMYDSIQEQPSCMAGRDNPCFGFDDHSVSSGDATTGQITFGGLAPGLYVVFALHQGASSQAPGASGADLGAGTTSGAMILGTKIPVSDAGGSVALEDLYQKDGVTPLRELGVLNVKGDEVAITIEIDESYKHSHPSFAIGDVMPFIVTTNIPNFDAFMRGSGNGGYAGGVVGSRFAASTANGAVQDGGASTGAERAGAVPIAGALPAANPLFLGVAAFASEAFASPLALPLAAEQTANPVRFDVVVEYPSTFTHPDVDGSDSTIRDMAVTVGEQTLQYSGSCELGVSNTSDACFRIMRSAADASGVVQSAIQIPNWILRAEGGSDVVITFEQIMQDAVNDDDASTEQAYDEVDGGPGTEDWIVAKAYFSSEPYVDDYTDFTDADIYDVATAREVAIFTFPLNITKIDAVSNETLPGAVFSVSTDEGLQCFAQQGDVYLRKSNAPCQSGTVGSVRSDNAGRLQIKGLQAHRDYRIRETKQPEGYAPANTDIINVTVRVEPTYDNEDRPNEVLATEYLYNGASYLHPAALPAFVRPATSEWVDNVKHIKHTFYAHEVDVLNGRTDQDVDAIAPFPWDVLAKTGAGIVAFALLMGLLMLLGMVLKRRRRSGGEGDAAGETDAIKTVLPMP